MTKKMEINIEKNNNIQFFLQYIDYNKRKQRNFLYRLKISF